MTAIASHPDLPVALDEFQIVRELGRGGMGIVYEAMETELSRRVALKILPRAAALDARQLARFQNEAQTAARLDHGHIVPVYTVGCKDGVHFYVMKHIDGRSLAEVIRTLQQTAEVGLAKQQFETELTDDDDTLAGTSSPSTIGGAPRYSRSSHEFFREAARLAAQAAEALHHAHLCGFTHGDVKPANLLVDGQGNVWLTDFGLARLTAELPDSCAAMPGTLRYLSPEQVRAEHTSCDHRTDIYSLGATIFELVTLEPAIVGDNTTEILDRIVSGAVPSPSQYNPSVPADLRAILSRAMAVDPNDRYPTALELAADLQRFLAGQPVPMTTSIEASRPLRRLLPRPAIVATAVLLTIFVVLPIVVVFPSMALLPSTSHQSTPILMPAELALQSLHSLNKTRLVELADSLARGGEPTEKDLLLLENGPEIYPAALDVSDKAGSFRHGLFQDQYANELGWAFYQLSAIHGRLNHRTQQGRLLRQAVELFEPLAAAKSPTYRTQLAALSMAEAEVHAAAGRNEEARKLGRGAIELAESLCKQDPKNSDHKIVSAQLHTDFGRMLLHVLPPLEVEQHHHTALTMLEPLVKDPSSLRSNASFSRQNLDDLVAECQVNLASCLELPNERKAILEPALEYLVDQVDQPADNDSDAEQRTSLAARAEQVMGEVFEQLGQRDDAQRHLELSIQLCDKLLLKSPAVIEYQFMLATAESLLGRTLAAAGKLAEADSRFQPAVDRLQQLVNSYPDFADYHNLLAASLNNRVHDLSPTDAAAQYELALQHQLVAIEINPDHRQYRRYASIQFSNLAARLVDLKENAKAAERLSQAVEHRKAVIRLGSLKYDDKHDLGHLLSRLSFRLWQNERTAEAETVYREGIDLFLGLTNQFGRRACDLGSLGAARNDLALILSEQGDNEAARRLLEDAILVQEEAIRSDPKNATYRTHLEKHQANLAELSANENDPPAKDPPSTKQISDR